MNTMNFFGELEFDENKKKYVIKNTKGISNFFFDKFDNISGTFSMPKMIRNGPIKQLVNDGEGVNIGGFYDYGIRKGIFQSLEEDKLTKLSSFDGYEETISISPDKKLACVMSTRFSKHTNFEMVGLVPAPYSVIVTYWFSYHLMLNSIGAIRKKDNIVANIGPALVDLEKSKNEKDYLGYNLSQDSKWIFNGFLSWCPDGKKIMFDEIHKTGIRRCTIVALKNYKPGKIDHSYQFKGNCPYSRSIKETLNLHLDYPKNIEVKGKSGSLTIFADKNKKEINYFNFSEDNEIYYNGTYSFNGYKDSGQEYYILRVKINVTGKKKGNCDYRFWFDKAKLMQFDLAEDGKNKSFGSCEYDGKKFNAEDYKYELIE